MKLKRLSLLLIVVLSGADRLPGDPLPGLYLTNVGVLSNGWGQFEVRTPDTNRPYVLLHSWATDFCHGPPRWEMQGCFLLDPATNRHLITLPLPMSTFGSIFFCAAPLGQQTDWISYSISSYGTLSNGVGIMPWPKQPDYWSAALRVENVTNFPAASEVLFTGPPGSGITNKPPHDDSGASYNHHYYLSGPTTVPPTGNWHVQYGTNALAFPMGDCGSTT